MRRASLLVACFATLCSPAFAQSVTRPNEGVSIPATSIERDGRGERDVASKVVVSAESAPVQKTRSLVSRASSKPQIDFNIPWQTGIYQ